MAEQKAGRSAVFDRLFADGRDPWGLQTSAYERAKRAATLAALGKRRFVTGLEVGCAFGVLTEELAPRCDRLIALDVSEVALARARARLGGQANIVFLHAEVPRDWPQECFDCMVWSEVLYFLSAEEIVRCSAAAREAILPDGVCVLVNWTGDSDLPISGNKAAELFIGHAGWSVAQQLRADRYRIDVLAD